ncbi:hypothetical protein [Micromonospora sp. NPDC051006]|uniref:hypothetical protein n=1 Tax=Micromonospora sp. NPDC051006 TaxID=3364283 RepID=UPI00378ED957
MGASDRLRWIDRGSPFTLMRPARDLRDVLRRHGYTVYDIGNQSHLEHEPPEDHTPYSETGYPGQAKYGVGYAIDIMPAAAGARSKVDGLPLPSLQQLGARLLADRNAGVPGIRWLKYMNWEPDRNNGGRCFKEAWRPTYKRTTSTDRGHIHMSGLTGYETSTVGAGYDPVTRIRGKDDDMSERASRVIEAWASGMPATSAKENVEPVKWRIRDEAWQKRVDGLLVALAASVEGLDMDAVLRRLDEHAAAEAERDAELADLVRQAKSGELDAAEFVRLVGEKLAAPAA